jgi:hypothetical protein
MPRLNRTTTTRRLAPTYVRAFAPTRVRELAPTSVSGLAPTGVREFAPTSVSASHRPAQEDPHRPASARLAPRRSRPPPDRRVVQMREEEPVDLLDVRIERAH